MSTKANTELMEAMSESHNAEMSYMNVKIASMTAGNIPLAGVTTGLVGYAVSFYRPPPAFPPPNFNPESIAVMQERARVALVNLKNILKPSKKKEEAP